MRFLSICPHSAFVKYDTKLRISQGRTLIFLKKNQSILRIKQVICFKQLFFSDTQIYFSDSLIAVVEQLRQPHQCHVCVFATDSKTFLPNVLRMLWVLKCSNLTVILYPQGIMA